jgi:hypothetical protein
VTRGPVAPVIPPDNRAVRRGPGAPGRPVSPLPLAGSPPGCPVAPGEAVYGLGRVDASGRVTGRLISEVLGWCCGDRLTLTADAGVVTAHRDPGGLVVLPGRARLMIPAPLRRRCGLRAGDPVLLAAFPGQDTLAAYSFAVVDQALQIHAPLRHGKAGQS